MIGQLWEIKLAYYPTDLLLGNYITYKEIYVPALKHSFNNYDNKLNVIKYNKNRYKSSSEWWFKNVKTSLIKTIKLDQKQIKILKTGVKLAS